MGMGVFVSRSDLHDTNCNEQTTHDMATHAQHTQVQALRTFFFFSLSFVYLYVATSYTQPPSLPNLH